MRISASTLAFGLLVTGFCWISGSAASAQELEQWLQQQKPRSQNAMLANVSPSYAAQGAVVASPSHNPDYRYHWIRDAALVMDTVFEASERADVVTRKALTQRLYDYVAFSRRNQQTPNPSGGADGMGLGEPKFNLDGSAFTGSWGRPQNDGPALRASTIMRFANSLLARGEEPYVRDVAYKVIKQDLEFVSHHWRDSSFDLWEEVRGQHFYTRMVQRRALVEGAAFADRMNDGGAADWYRQQASLLEREIEHHWDSGRGLIVATLGRDGGLGYKDSNVDVAVVLGVLHGRARVGKPFFAATDDRVLSSARKVEEAFSSLYPINRRDRDWDNQPMGVAIGRYPEDKYTGYSSDGPGNPWFLATNALAELYFRAANDWERAGSIRVTAASARFIGALKAYGRLPLAEGETIASSDPRFFSALRAVRAAGDAFLRRTRFHCDPNGGISEQMNRDSGYMQGAEQLTWSHASLLTAAWERGDAKF